MTSENVCVYMLNGAHSDIFPATGTAPLALPGILTMAQANTQDQCDNETPNTSIRTVGLVTYCCDYSVEG